MTTENHDLMARHWPCHSCQKTSDLFTSFPTIATLKALLSGDAVVVTCSHCGELGVVRLEGHLLCELSTIVSNDSANAGGLSPSTPLL